MSINFFVDPYYDDFDASKGFHRILFKPGVAVQARELTQLQTIINNQITQFGNNIFKDGTIIHRGVAVYDTNYHSVKLEGIYNTVNADDILQFLDGEIITGATSGVSAKVIGVQATEGVNPPVLYVRYLDSGTSKTSKTFNDAEVLSFSSYEVQTIATASCNKGSAYIISDGVMYARGAFVYFPAQTTILNAFGPTTDAVVGFRIAESIVTSTQDSTLLDPASGSYNYTAPGADRYVIELVIENRTIADDLADDPDFIEMARIKNGVLISQTTGTEYNVLADTMARRTYDESGDYVVNPYTLNMKEHLRASYDYLNGLYTAAEGGLSSKMVAMISAGKSYVKGYEVENIAPVLVECDKARDSAVVTDGNIGLTFGNYVVVNNLNSLPPVDQIPTVDLYDQYTASVGSPAGTKIGTARVRAVTFKEGTQGSAAAQYNVFLFDVKMNEGYSFNDDVKQLYAVNALSEDFTCDTLAYQTSTLSGTVSLTSASGAVTGVGTKFLSQLSVGEYIKAGADTYRVSAITDDLNLTISPVASETISGTTFTIAKARITDSDKSTYIFKLPYDVIKTVNSTGLDARYFARKVYNETLSAGVVTITASSDETFLQYSADNYIAVLTSGANDGNVIDLSATSFNIVGQNLTIDFNGAGISGAENVRIITTVQKDNSASDEKVKSLSPTTTIDFLTEAAGTAQTLSLDKADIYRVVSVKMTTTGAWGDGSYNTTTEIDITDRYDLDNGQRPTYYGIGTLKLKAGAAKPTAPVRVTFQYFTHSNGDYFTVDSYTGIDYANIPSVTFNGVTYNLRDCVDFRPRLSNDGTGFTGTGASTTDFPDFDNGMSTSYEYYLPRYDKIVLNADGQFKYIKGDSSLEPKEPTTPSNSMLLYVIRQNPYVFSLSNDVKVVPMSQRRYTMKEIGKLESRISNIEYYTSLTLLEQDAKNYQIKDADGFDRFKNGFVVDSFKGHGIGDYNQEDYNCSIDEEKFELRPAVSSYMFDLTEVAADDTARAAAGYSLKDGIITIKPTTESVVIQNTRASKIIDLNPFDVIAFEGKMKLEPVSDKWMSEYLEPEVVQDEDGDWDILKDFTEYLGISESDLTETTKRRINKYKRYHDKYRKNRKYHSRYNYWYLGRNVWRDVRKETNLSYSEFRQKVKDWSPNWESDIDNAPSSLIRAKRGDIQVRISIEGMKPNTELFFALNDTDISEYVWTFDITEDTDGTPTGYWPVGAPGPVYTDAEGKAECTFFYSGTKYDLPKGNHEIRASDSETMDETEMTTYAEAVFESTGEYRPKPRRTRTPRVRRRVSRNVTKKEPAAQYTVISGVTAWAAGRTPQPTDKANWQKAASNLGVTNTTVTNAYVNPAIDPLNIQPSDYNEDARKLYELNKQMITSMVANNDLAGLRGEPAKQYLAKAGGDVDKAIHLAAVDATTAIATGGTTAATAWKSVAASAKANGV